MALNDEVGGDAFLAANIICSLRFADISGWAPSWGPTKDPPPTDDVAADSQQSRVLIWPAVARGKRSRRSPGTAVAKAARWARGSPASPLEYSGGSGSGASTSGAEEGSCSADAAAAAAVVGVRGGRHVGPSSLSKQLGSGRREPLILLAQTPRPNGQRSRKKMRLPEVREIVRSLTEENVMLREEMEVLQRACTALSNENCKLESRLGPSSAARGTNSLVRDMKQRPGTSSLLCHHSPVQNPQPGFVLPDLNLPAQEDIDRLMP